MREEQLQPYQEAYEHVREFVAENSDLVTQEMADITRFLYDYFSSYAFWMPAIILSLIANNILRDRKAYEQQVRDRTMIPIEPGSYILYDRNHEPDISISETLTQVIIAYPNGEDPSVIEYGSHVHESQLKDLKRLHGFYQRKLSE